jgi:hypothetical protein
VESTDDHEQQIEANFTELEKEAFPLTKRKISSSCQTAAAEAKESMTPSDTIKDKDSPLIKPKPDALPEVQEIKRF